MKMILFFALLFLNFLLDIEASEILSEILPKKTSEKLFGTQATAIDLRIEADLSKVREFKEEMNSSVDPENRAVPAKLSFSKEGVALGNFNAKIIPRGLTRNYGCIEYPLFKIDLKKKELPGTLFEGFNDKFKIVTHCKRYAGEDITLEESQAITKLKEEFFRYLAYRYFNPEFSFKTQLLRVTYIEPNKGPVTSYAFLIEHKSDIKKRTGYDYINPSDDPCTKEELAAIFSKECSYMSMKFIKALRQKRQLDALIRKYKASDVAFGLSLKSQYYQNLAVIGALSDHGFAQNNSTIFYKISENNIDIKVIPYDFDRYDSEQQVSFDWFHSNFYSDFQTLSPQEWHSAFQEITNHTEAIANKVESFYTDFYSPSRGPETFRRPYNLMNFAQSFSEFFNFASRYPDIWYKELTEGPLP